MHNGYYFVGDNVDMVTKVRHMTITNKHKDQHMFQMCAYENRISGNHLEDRHPLQNADKAEFSQVIPGDKERENILKDFSFLVAKAWGKYIPHFAPFAASLPEYIDRPYIEKTRTKTKRVNMGVLKKNESKHDEMVDICQFLNKYVPNSADASSVPIKILSGGDYLTFERHEQAQMSQRDQDTPYNRLEGLVPKMEEFHNQAELMKVMWQILYSSSRDIGTLYAARNITDTRNVSTDPSRNFYASSVMAEKFTDAYIVAGALKYFGMSSTVTVPIENIYKETLGDTSQMKEYLSYHAREFLKQYLDFDIPALPDYGPKSNTYECRYCSKKYIHALGLRKHEHKVHDHYDPLYDIPNPALSKISNQKDRILNYTKCVLFIGLLRKNQNDAISMGDSSRMMLVNQYLCLLYKLSGCPKYAFGMLETICQSKILLSPRLAHRLIWNRTVNHRGKIDSNLPNDLDLEHCNKIFKDEAHSFRGEFTDKTISRVSRSALATHLIVKNFDKETETHSASGIHKKADLTQDVNVIVMQLLQQNVYDNILGKKHDAFPEIKSNPFH